MLLLKLDLDKLVNGSVVDTSGNNRTVVCTGVKTIPDPEGKFGTCVTFDGTTTKLKVDGLTCPSQFTFAAWVRKSPSLSPGYATLVEFGDDSPYFGFIGGKPVLYRGATATQDFGLSWNHIVVTQDASVSRLYVNGALVATGPAVRSGATGVGIGYNSGDSFFKGEMRNVLIYDEAVSVRTSQNAIWLDSADSSSLVVNAQRLAPVAVTARSNQNGYTPAQLLTNLTDPSTANFWHSAINSGVDEWVEYDLGVDRKLIPCQIEAHFVTGRAGSPRIQGSNDRVTWSEIYTLTMSRPFEVASGFMGVKEVISAPGSAGYRYIRLISGPAPYLCYSFLELSGVLVSNRPAAVTARSNQNGYTPAELLTNLTDPSTTNFWHSAINSGVDEWVEYDYGASQKLVPTQMVAHFVNGRSGGAIKIQGSNDRLAWTDICSPSLSQTYPVATGWVGATVAIPAPAKVGYRYLRLNSTPAPYLCYSFLEFSGEFVMSVPVVAVAVSSNANGYTPAQLLTNLTNPSANDWWISASNSGVAEWIEYDYGAGRKFAPTQVVAHFVNGRSGGVIKIQGSNDRFAWTDICSPSFNQTYPVASGWLGATVDITAPAKVGYRYLRLIAGPTVYMCYSFLSFTGELV